MQHRIRAVVMRGGTSRAVFFHQADLPVDPEIRDRVILKIYGGGDPYGRQIDGLGGATSVTSKTAIIGPASVPDADVDYTFGQVSVGKPLIDYGGNCGNISSAVGPFAIEEGLVRATDPVTQVRIWQTNTRKRIIAHVPTAGGVPQAEGEHSIDGVPGAGALILLEFLNPGGSMTGRLLPTGHPTDALDVPGVGGVTVSLIDAANPVVFIRPSDLGLTGLETAERVDGDPALLSRIEAVRAHAAVRMGLAPNAAEASAKSPGVPKIAFVTSPQEYIAADGRVVAPAGIEVVGRIMTMGRLHRAYALTGAICTAVAAQVEGTLVHEAARAARSGERSVRIGHPSGVIEIGVDVRRSDGAWIVEKVTTQRTARRLMEGAALIPASVWPEAAGRAGAIPTARAGSPSAPPGPFRR
jgi:2-methylaconitate cis-trans-isomerase PrpF